MDTTLEAAERLLHSPSPPTDIDYDRVLRWLDRQPKDGDGRAGHALQMLCYEALRTQNGRMFWLALVVAGWGRLLTGWLPTGDLAYLVEAVARALARRWRTRAVTVAEAADVLGYSEVHVRRLIKAGKLRAKRLPTKPTRWEVANADVYKLAAAA